MLDEIKKFLFVNLTGRLVVLGLAALSGFMLHYLPTDATEVVNNWLAATKALADVVLPILIAGVLSYSRRQVALYTDPPVQDTLAAVVAESLKGDK